MLQGEVMAASSSHCFRGAEASSAGPTLVARVALGVDQQVDVRVLLACGVAAAAALVVAAAAAAAVVVVVVVVVG
jgi:hypothetical protein